MDALIATTRELDAALFAARARLAEAERDRDAALAAAGAMAAVCEAADRVERGFSRSKSETTVNVYPNGVDALDGFDLFDLLRAALAAWRAGRDPGSEK
jgi:hypothetical protein